jgi:hypothetical protein
MGIFPKRKEKVEQPSEVKPKEIKPKRQKLVKESWDDARLKRGEEYKKRLEKGSQGGRMHGS